MNPCPHCGTTTYTHRQIEEAPTWTAFFINHSVASGPCPAVAELVPLVDVERVLLARADMVARSGGDGAPYRNAADMVRYCLTKK